MILLEDVHGLHGGRILKVCGDGRVEWTGTPPACPGREIATRIESARVALWLRQAAEGDLLGCPEPPLKPRTPGEACPRLTLSGSGGQATRLCWEHDLPMAPSFRELYQSLLQLERELTATPL